MLQKMKIIKIRRAMLINRAKKVMDKKLSRDIGF